MIFLILPAVSVNAQSKHLFYLLGVENLFSTHGTNFTGVNVSVNKSISGYFDMGAGGEYAHCKFHNDNGFNLYNLNFAPLYVSQNIYFLRMGGWNGYIHLREGISFVSYKKENQTGTQISSLVRETGFYGFGGVGADYKLNSKWALTLQSGLKGYHLSTNNLDVNPHGITLLLGAKYVW